MKILKIKLNNINCLRCNWEIDFEKQPLSSSGLFAITGPMGSGKSTLLDAITLGLFNRIPRFERDLSKGNIDKAGFILTRNEVECYVEVDYSCSKGTFRSKWSISKTRNNTFREHHMELQDLSTGNLLDLKKSEVPKNEEFIGLKYDQFIKSILLSQGGFSKFLDSKKDDRSKLLEDITGMDIYSKLGSKAYDTFKKKNETIKLKKEMLEFVKGQLLSIEELEQLKAEQQKLSEKLKQQQDKVAVLKKLIDTKNRIETIKNEIKELLKRLNETEEKEKEFKLYKKEKVERHKQLLPFVEVIQSYMATQERIKEIQTQVKDESRKKQIGKTDQQELIKEIQAFIQQPTDAAYAITQISNFRQKVNELITNKQQEENSLHQQQKRVKPFLSKP